MSGSITPAFFCRVKTPDKNLDRIFLIGPMGTGKTTIGNHLSRLLKFTFYDCDRELEARTGASISLIFDVEGEAGFRERETRLIDELSQENEIVLSTGGGAVLAAENRTILAERGYVVYLRTPVEKLIERTRFDTTRPLLQTADPATTLRNIVTERDPLYQEIADLIVDTDLMPVKQIAKRIVDARHV